MVWCGVCVWCVFACVQVCIIQYCGSRCHEGPCCQLQWTVGTGKPKKKKLKSTPRSRKSEVRRRTAASFSSDEGRDEDVGPSDVVHRGGSGSEEEGSEDGSGEWSDSGGSESSEPSLEFTDGLDENLFGDTDDRARCVDVCMCEENLLRVITCDGVGEGDVWG